MEVDAGPSPSRRERGLKRWLTTAWCLLAGAFLSVAPHAASVWHDGFYAGTPVLRDLLLQAAVRWSISGFGVVLLAAGAWDVSRFLVEELS